MKRKSEQKSLFGGVTMTTAMIFLGAMLATGALVGLVVSNGGLKSKSRMAEYNPPPPIRAVHIKPDLTQVKKETSPTKQVMMTPAMLRQMSLLDERIASLEGQIRSLSKSNLDLAEKVDTSVLDTRLQALEDSLTSFTASIDKRMKQVPQVSKKPEDLPKMNELTQGERKLLPPPFKTDSPKDVSMKADPAEEAKKTPAKTTAQEVPKAPTVKKEMASETELVKKAETKKVEAEKPEAKTIEAKKPEAKKPEVKMAKVEPQAPIKKEEKKKPPFKKQTTVMYDLSKPVVEEDPQNQKKGWEPTVTYHAIPKKTKLASAIVNPRYSTRAASPEITGSIKKPAAAKKVVRKKKKPQPFAVHIASATTLYRIKDSWLVLSRDNGILRSLTPHIVSAPAGKTSTVPWKLLAGPVANENEAARICTRLNAKGSFCRRTTLTGTPLKY